LAAVLAGRALSAAHEVLPETAASGSDHCLGRQDADRAACGWPITTGDSIHASQHWLPRPASTAVISCCRRPTLTGRRHDVADHRSGGRSTGVVRPRDRTTSVFHLLGVVMTPTKHHEPHLASALTVTPAVSRIQSGGRQPLVGRPSAIEGYAGKSMRPRVSALITASSCVLTPSLACSDFMYPRQVCRVIPSTRAIPRTGMPVPR
jgi:hypothetical protein